MDPKNAAARMYLLLDMARRSQGKTAVELWGDVFRFPKMDAHKMTMEVAQRLIWMDVELSSLIEILRTEKGYPEDGYSVVQNGVRSAISPRLLASQGDHVRQHLKPEVLASLYQMALNISDEESAVSSEHIAELEEIVRDLSQRLDEGDTGPFLSAILRRHIRLLQRAVDAYPILGVRAFYESLRDAVGDLYELYRNEEQSESTRGDTKGVVGALAIAWRRVSTIAAEADKVHKVYALAGYAVAALAWAKDHLP